MYTIMPKVCPTKLQKKAHTEQCGTCFPPMCMYCTLLCIKSSKLVYLLHHPQEQNEHELMSPEQITQIFDLAEIGTLTLLYIMLTFY